MTAGGGVRRRRPAVPTLLAGLLVAYLVVPVVLTFTRLGPGHWEGLGSRSVWSALGTSVVASTIATAVTLLTGVPLAWLLARARSPGWRRRVATTVGAAVQIPLAMPPLVSGLLLIRILGPYTFLGRLSGGRLTESLWGIVAAQTFVAGPFLIVAARSAFAGVDPALSAVAATLGHGRWSRFFRVELAEALPGIRTGTVLTWLRAFGEFGATILLAYHPYSLPVFTYVQFDSGGLSATQVPVDLAIATAAIVVALGQIRLPRRRVPTPAVGVAPEAGLAPALPGAQRPVSVQATVAAPSVQGPAPAATAAAPAPPVLDFSVCSVIGGFQLAAAHRATSPRIALLGPSGAGKSLTLQLLAGLRPSQGGWVRLGGEDIGRLGPERRGIGYVPQGGALMPRLDVWRQVTFAPAAAADRASWWLERLGLVGLEGRLPAQLSGGQAQRVALARALAGPSRLLLLDEPLSALDTPARRALRSQLRELQLSARLATVVVTHDPEEAALLADDIVVLSHGGVLQAGSRREVFTRPASVEAANLLGVDNVRQGVWAGPGLVSAGGLMLPALDVPGPGPVLWSVDPEGVVAGGGGRWPARVVDVVDLGRRVEAVLELAAGLTLVSRHRSAEHLSPGQGVGVDLPAVTAWAPATSRRAPVRAVL